jgi:4-hydroxy-tetrahydrodipicolinate reductase
MTAGATTERGAVSARRRVAVLGAAGRLGTTACAAVAAAPDLELVAAVVRPARLPWTVARPDGGELEAVADIGALPAAGAEVALDVSAADALLEHATLCARAGIHLVVGVSGIDAELREALERLFAGTGLGCRLVPNFAVGAVLANHMAALAAPFASSIEVVEMHHAAKRDAPSGTARAAATSMAVARAAAGSPPLLPEEPDASPAAPSRGSRGPGGIRLHSIRLAGAVAHQEIRLGLPGQILTISHDSLDRSSFVPGMLLALRRAGSPPGTTEGLEDLLGLRGAPG